jgi:hypothetical protein
MYFDEQTKKYQSQMIRISRIFLSTSIKQRNPSFKKLTTSDLSHFESILGKSGVTTTDLDAFNKDWMGKYTGSSKCLLQPKSTDQVSKILKYCNDESIAVVPQGGNTGLVGGGVPVFDGTLRHGITNRGDSSIRKNGGDQRFR